MIRSDYEFDRFQLTNKTQEEEKAYIEIYFYLHSNFF